MNDELLRSPLTDDYNLRETLEAAQDEAVKLIRQREAIDYRISRLQEDIVHLAALCRIEVEDPVRQLGLTDAVRWTLAREKKSLNVKEIVELLRLSNPEFSEYKNLGANVQTIIRRLLKAKEVAISPAAPLTNHPAEMLKGIPKASEKYQWLGGLPPMPPPPSWLTRKISDKDAIYKSGIRGDEKPK